MATEVEYDHLFKVVLLGNSGVGKTSILHRWADGTFAEDRAATIGTEAKVRMLPVSGKMCRVSVWDTAGAERFRSIAQHYFRGAHGAVLVFDVADEDSFAALPSWLHDLEGRQGITAGIRIPTILVANKVDVNRRLIEHDTAAEFARSHDMLYVETSAKSDINIDTVFLDVVREILLRPDVLRGTGPASHAVADRVELQPAPPPPAKRGCC